MTFRKVDWVYVVGAGLVILAVSLLPSPKDRNPPVPATPDHRLVTSEKDCVRCHAVSGTRPLPERHPKRPDCFRCHRGTESHEGQPERIGQRI